MGDMPQLIVELHVPLTETEGLPAGEYPFPWIEQIEDIVQELDEEDGQEYDDGEEVEGNYVFFLTGASEETLLSTATRIANLPGVPAGAYAMVTDDEAETFGLGRRVELPSS